MAAPGRDAGKNIGGMPPATGGFSSSEGRWTASLEDRNLPSSTGSLTARRPNARSGL